MNVWTLQGVIGKRYPDRDDPAGGTALKMLFASSISHRQKGDALGILWWIVVGVIAGCLGELVMKGRGFGLPGSIIVGIAGGLLGGWLASTLFAIPRAMSEFNLGGTLVAFLIAVLLIFSVRMLWGLRKNRKPVSK